MNRLILAVITILSCCLAQAEQTGQLLLNPYHPEFGEQQTQIEVLDANLTNELVRFAERRDRIQKVWIEHMPYDPNLIESNSFVLKRVLDRTASRLMKSDLVKKSALGRASESVKEKMETNVTFKDEKNVNHRFDFKIAAFQGQAFIQYSGFTKTQLRYDMSENNVAMIFQHDLSQFSSVGIETTLAGENQTQLLLLNLVW